MGLFDGFPFQSREQAEKEKREFALRVFPLGLEQRERARAVLMELLPNLKKQETMAMFAFISAKDFYTQHEQDEKALELLRKQLKKQRLTEENKDRILALLVLDAKAASLESYPSAQDVLDYIQSQ